MTRIYGSWISWSPGDGVPDLHPKQRIQIAVRGEELGGLHYVHEYNWGQDSLIRGYRWVEENLEPGDAHGAGCGKTLNEGWVDWNPKDGTPELDPRRRIEAKIVDKFSSDITLSVLPVNQFFWGDSSRIRGYRLLDEARGSVVEPQKKCETRKHRMKIADHLEELTHYYKQWADRDLNHMETDVTRGLAHKVLRELVKEWV